MSFLIFLLMAWAFERACLIISAPNYSSLYNGFGAIEGVVGKHLPSPMAYRVLVPFCTVWIEKLFRLPLGRRLDVYTGLKILGEAFAFWLVSLAWGPAVLAVVVALLLATVKFDYWDWIFELAAVAAAMTGQLELALPAVLLAAVSRETAPLFALAYWLKTGDGPASLGLLVIAIVVLALVRLFIGKRSLYCDRWQWRYNLALFAGRVTEGTQKGKLIFFAWQPFIHSDAVIALVLSLGTIYAAICGVTGWPVALILCVAGWSMAKADETRVFSSCLPFLAAAFVR